MDSGDTAYRQHTGVYGWWWMVVVRAHTDSGVPNRNQRGIRLAKAFVEN